MASRFASLSGLEIGPKRVINQTIDPMRRQQGGQMIRRLSVRLLDEDAAAGAARAQPSFTRMRLLERAVIGGGAVIAGGALIGGLPGIAP